MSTNADDERNTKWLPYQASGYEMANKPKIKKKERMVKKKEKRERKQQHFLKRKRRQVISASNGTKAGYT